jgi:hypothetical protein
MYHVVLLYTSDLEEHAVCSFKAEDQSSMFLENAGIILGGVMFLYALHRQT